MIRSLSGIESDGIWALLPSELDAATLAILDRWVEKGEPEELRAEAKEEFEKCFQEKSPRFLLSLFNLTTLPDIFESFPFVTEIDVEHNCLTSLPESLCQLSSLKILNLNTNQLKTLPENFGNLSSLEILDLSFNRLEKLPKSFENLKSLIELKICGCYQKLDAFPENLIRALSLKKCDLSGWAMRPSDSA